MELPGRKDAIEIIKDNMPGKEEDWGEKNWGKDAIDDAEKCGPVYYLQYEGKIEGVSFKEDDFETASSNRKKVMDALDTEGILMHEDSLKTQKILDAYLK